MELSEMIKVMQHFDNGGEVERSFKGEDSWKIDSDPAWNWKYFDYKIKEQKQKVTIERWLCRSVEGDFVAIETSDIDAYIYHKKVKLIESYEIKL